MSEIRYISKCQACFNFRLVISLNLYRLLTCKILKIVQHKQVQCSVLIKLIGVKKLGNWEMTLKCAAQKWLSYFH